MPRITHPRDDWDNMSQMIPENQPIESFEACGLACEDEPECIQYSFINDECRHSNVALLGQRVADGRGQARSGWVKSRIERLREGLKKCNGQAWVLP